MVSCIRPASQGLCPCQPYVYMCLGPCPVVFFSLCRQVEMLQFLAAVAKGVPSEAGGAVSAGQQLVRPEPGHQLIHEGAP